MRGALQTQAIIFLKRRDAPLFEDSLDSPAVYQSHVTVFIYFKRFIGITVLHNSDAMFLPFSSCSID